ncbi:CDP-alcohol phosphatidyltransferase family protein [Paeniglutamicibacter psychrophenolicus]|uniref:CDP-alcohol phosphatidyltransferase family protein n=1 Tax=Paeniglutamicibacter psychrophenolicus TaxID=257454 RepID=UPI00277F0184|nr:CDP-alcohol phosphatidyltransferase family protein [Paeniglutamicibacter psychrophenolicus]MDQ0092663.1 phosphatidylglycerophosphate synthase [Paeniglutamicibacter psychrophenolicus]
MSTSQIGGDTGARAGFGAVLADLENAQKPGAGVPAYTRWVNRRAARVVAAAAVHAGIGPNVVSLLSALVSFAGLALLALVPAGWTVGVAAACLLALGYIMDSADGQVARVTGTGSPAGEWLDHVIDAVRTPALHLVVLIGFHRWFDAGPALLLLPLAFSLLAVGHFMSQILAEQLGRQLASATPGRRTAAPAEASLGKGPAWSVLMLPVDTGTMCWLFVLWGSPALFTACYALLFAVHLVFACISAARKFKSLHGGAK